MSVVNRSLFQTVFAVVCLVVLASAVAFQNVPPETPVATVDGEAITEGDLQFIYLARGVRDELKPSVRDQYIDDLIDRALLKKFLAAQNINASDAIVDERVLRMEKLVTREGLDFTETLEDLGYSRETFREAVAQPVVWSIHARRVITDKAILTYWRQHKARFDGTEVKAAQIVKRVPKDATADQLDELKSQLAALKGKIAAGEVTFADAAKAESDSPSGKDGGDIGQFVYRGRMPVELTSVAFSLKPGAVSEPFQSPFGMHLLTVLEVIPGDLSLEDTRGEIFGVLSRELQKRLIAELRKNADIRKVGAK